MQPKSTLNNSIVSSSIYESNFNLMEFVEILYQIHIHIFI